MSVLALVREELRDFAGYSSARNEAHGGEVLLNANESPWPQPGDALGLNRYPDPQPESLRASLAGLYGVAVESVLVGRGSDEPIDLLVRALCRAGRDSVLIAPPTFGMYAVAARVQNAAVIEVPLRADQDFRLDVARVLAAVDASVKIVFACSPNNPTGRSVPLLQLRELAQAVSGRALLVIDEAYAEFSAAESALALVRDYEHVAVLRTLSKAYALAGARIGTLIADPALIRVLRAIMAPYPLPTPCVRAALHALAPAQLALARSRINLLREERERLAGLLRRSAAVTEVFASDANFLLVRFRDGAKIYEEALAAGIVLRNFSSRPGLSDCLRISIGAPEQNDALLQVLAKRAVPA